MKLKDAEIGKVYKHYIMNDKTRGYVIIRIIGVTSINAYKFIVLHKKCNVYYLNVGTEHSMPDDFIIEEVDDLILELLE